jgi:hypothetical protein
MKRSFSLMLAIAVIALSSLSVSAQVRQTKLFIDDGSGNFTILNAAPGGGTLTLPSSGTLLTTTSTIPNTATWNGAIISPTYGGTGVNNGASSITLGGNLVTSGASSLTLTTSGATNVTLPTSGTLATTSALSSYLPLSGGTMTGALDMGTHVISSVTNPSSAQDAATKNYVDNRPGVVAWGVLSFNSGAGTASLVSSYNCSGVSVGGGPFFAITGISPGSHSNYSVMVSWQGGVGSSMGSASGILAGWWDGTYVNLENYVQGGGGTGQWPVNYVTFVLYGN